MFDSKKVCIFVKRSSHLTLYELEKIYNDPVTEFRSQMLNEVMGSFYLKYGKYEIFRERFGRNRF